VRDDDTCVEASDDRLHAEDVTATRCRRPPEIGRDVRAGRQTSEFSSRCASTQRGGLTRLVADGVDTEQGRERRIVHPDTVPEIVRIPRKLSTGRCGTTN